MVVVISGAYMLLVFGPVFVWSLIARRTDSLYRWGVRGCRLAVHLAGIRLDVRGGEKIPTDRAVVFMPNHQSFCDPPAVLTVLPPVLVLLKESLFRIPILGLAMRRHGFVAIAREHRERALRSVEEAAAKLRAGNSFLVYPEGTRTRDGRLLPFKRGAFLMALRAQAPIVPVSVSGAFKVMRKGQMTLHPGTVRITFHDPIPTEDCSEGGRDTLVQKVRAAVASGLTEDEQPVGMSSPHKSPDGTQVK